MKTAICLSAVLLTLTAPAYALEKPRPGKADSRIRYVNYNPNNIVELWTTPSGIMEIQFGADERVPEGNVAVADGANIGRKTRGNFLYLKLAKCIQPQLMLVRFRSGRLRL